jgi:chromosome partitioning protein
MRMKTIATINFKGGVGKTTVTWCLADILANYGYHLNALIFDLDAQMSLTQAIALNDMGSLNENFGKWYAKTKEHKKTIFDALDKYASPSEGGHFDFGIGYDFIYQVTNNLHFIPSVEDLYWMELEIFNRDSVKEFIRRMLAKIDNSNKVAKYNYALFDCPPSFTLLSYSVLSTCDLILIPVNPDFFASKGVGLLIDSLRWRIEPYPIPKIGVFMNKAKPYGDKFTKETEFYWSEVKGICNRAARENNVKVKTFDTKIPDRVAIKRAITAHGVPDDLVSPFRNLWTEINQYLNQ